MSIGPHLSHDNCQEITGKKTFGDGVVALRNDFGSRVFQIFDSVPQTSAPANLNDQNMKRPALEGSLFVVHANYLCHFTEKSIRKCEEQYTRSARNGADAVVFHLGNAHYDATLKHCSSLLRLARAMAKPPKIILELNPILRRDYLEPGVSSNFDTAAKLEHLCNDLLNQTGAPRSLFGVCIDTAHLWSYGVDIRTAHDMGRWLDGFKDPTWVSLIHLNDSASVLGGPDVHAPIGRGQMWNFGPKWDYDFFSVKSEQCGFHAILKFAKKHGIDSILERSQYHDTKAELTGLLAYMSSIPDN